MHDLLPKHSTVDTCDGISDAVEEFSHHPGINQTRQAEMGTYSAGGKYWSLNRSKWLDGNFCVGTQQWDEHAMQGFRSRL